MLAVKIEILRFVNDTFPGLVECKLRDANGGEWLFVEKVPVVTEAPLDAKSNYPQAGVIACEWRKSRIDADGREVLEIDTDLPWHVESTTGLTLFEVLPEQLTEIR